MIGDIKSVVLDECNEDEHICIGKLPILLISYLYFFKSCLLIAVRFVIWSTLPLFLHVLPLFLMFGILLML